MSWRGFGARSLTKLPAGVEGTDAIGMKIPLGPKGKDQRQVVVVKSDKERKQYDRLYVDVNGNGTFQKAECYDIRRSAGPVEVTTRGSNYRQAMVGPIEFAGKEGQEPSPRWIMLRVGDYGPGNYYISCTKLTCATGKVRIDGKEMRLALYNADFHTSGGLNRAVELPDPGAAEGARRVRTGCQVLLDVNGNGKFDRLRIWGVGPENRWLTRLIRLDGKYYELNVAQDGGSIRITPSKPKLGKLKVPEHVESATLIGPEFAANVTSRAKPIELPAGGYVVSQYRYRRATGTLSASDRLGKAVFEIRPGQTSSFKAGPPLTMRVSHDGHIARRRSNARARRNVRLSLEMLDCAGRQISDVQTAKGKRPDAPKFKIVDSKGKTVLSDAFKYG